MSLTGILLKIIWGVVDDGTLKFILNDTLSKHAIGDIVYKPVNKTSEHEYLLPLDGQALDTTKYKRLVDYLGTDVLPNLNGRYLRADSTPGQMVEAGLPNIRGWANIVFYTNSDLLTDDVDGAFYSTWKSKSQGGTGDAHSTGNLSFDASRSSAVYGKSDTVTPLTYTVRAYICYA